MLDNITTGMNSTIKMIEPKPDFVVIKMMGDLASMIIKYHEESDVARDIATVIADGASYFEKVNMNMFIVKEDYNVR